MCSSIKNFKNIFTNTSNFRRNVSHCEHILHRPSLLMGMDPKYPLYFLHILYAQYHLEYYLPNNMAYYYLSNCNKSYQAQGHNMLPLDLDDKQQRLDEHP